MKTPPEVFVLVTSDPRSSPRAAEGVRVAAGLAGWQKLRVTLCLWDAAALGLAETRDDLHDADLFRQHLPGLIEAGGRIVVRDDNPFVSESARGGVAFSKFSAADLARTLAGHSTILRF